MENKSPEEIAQCARNAAVMEASAEKPGNVTPTKSFDNLVYQDFVDAAERLKPFVEQAAREGRDAEIGKLIFDATSEERNINFGIILMFLPLAATQGRGTRGLLKSLSVKDTEWIIKAMQKGKLGSMELKGKSLPKYDVLSEDIFEVIREESITPLRLMKLSQPYDLVAREWVGDFTISRAMAKNIETDAESIVNEFLVTLAKYPDTLIARKAGLKEAKRISHMAIDVLSGSVSMAKFDEYLRAEGNSLNPGTTADLVATALFLKLMTQDG